jgi:hypothetical protein
VLRHIVTSLPHLTALDVPVTWEKDLQVITGQLDGLKSLTIRLGREQWSSLEGELKRRTPTLTSRTAPASCQRLHMRHMQ